MIRMAGQTMKDRKTNEDVGEKKIGKATVEASATKKEDQVEVALAAKAKLYDQILAGKAKLSSDLVNFDDKVNEGYVAPPQQEVTAAMLPPRPPTMPKPVSVDLAVSTAQPSASARSSSFVASKSTPASDVSTTPHYNWSTTYHGAAADQAKCTPIGGNSGDSSSSSMYSAQQSSRASAYDGRDYNNEYLREADQQRQLRQAVDEKIHAEAEGREKSAARSAAYNPYTGRSGGPAGEDGGAARVSEAARVKTQWEKTLNSSARGFLEDIHMDTTRQREQSAEVYLGHAGSSGVSSYGASTGTESGQKRSAKEERLEMIRQKRSKSGLC
jgi:hypothetical protein